MKRQYLGDARDAFKWEYQDHLVRQLGFDELQIVPMLTLDDGTNEGNIHSTRFPAASVIHEFCSVLRESRSLEDLKKLPTMTGADYRVRLHRPETTFLDYERESYFSKLHCRSDQLVFVDPDIGFEPRGRYEKHVGFADVVSLLNQISEDSAICVYQHERRSESFQETLEGIRHRLSDLDCAAIYGHNVMFITFSRSRSTIERVSKINVAYAADRRLRTEGPPGSMDMVLSALNKYKIRATYGAVGEYLTTEPQSVGRLLGSRRPEASWVVSRRDGLPTGYAVADYHNDLQSNPMIIDTGDELAALLKHGC